MLPQTERVGAVYDTISLLAYPIVQNWCITCSNLSAHALRVIRFHHRCPAIMFYAHQKHMTPSHNCVANKKKPPWSLARPFLRFSFHSYKISPIRSFTIYPEHHRPDCALTTQITTTTMTDTEHENRHLLSSALSAPVGKFIPSFLSSSPLPYSAHSLIVCTK